MQPEGKALGTIRRKPELYSIPLKRALVLEGGPQQEGLELTMDHIPYKDMQWAIDGVAILWYQGDVHLYIVGRQHIYQACISIAAKEEPGSARHKFSNEYDVVFVYSCNPIIRIKVSNALNIQVKDKVVTENFRSQLKNESAKWIEKGLLRPKKAGAKHDPTFKVNLHKPLYPFITQFW